MKFLRLLFFSMWLLVGLWCLSCETNFIIEGFLGHSPMLNYIFPRSALLLLWEARGWHADSWLFRASNKKWKRIRQGMLWKNGALFDLPSIRWPFFPVPFATMAWQTQRLSIVCSLPSPLPYCVSLKHETFYHHSEL